MRHPFRQQCIRNCEIHHIVSASLLGVGFGQTFGRGVCYSAKRATKPSKDLMSGTRATFFPNSTQETFCRSNFPKRQILIEPCIFQLSLSNFL